MPRRTRRANLGKGEEEDLAGVQDTTRNRYTKQGRDGLDGREGPKLGEGKEEERRREEKKRVFIVAPEK